MNRRAFLSTIVGRPSPFPFTIPQPLSLPQGARKGGEETVAVIDHRLCIAWDGGDCQLCFIQCPLRETAIQLDDLKPVIHSTACNGCGICRLACATVNDQVAIRMTTAVTSGE